MIYLKCVESTLIYIPFYQGTPLIQMTNSLPWIDWVCKSRRNEEMAAKIIGYCKWSGEGAQLITLFIGVTSKSAPYVHASSFFYSYESMTFFLETYEQVLLNKFAGQQYTDETAINVMLWKHNVCKASTTTTSSAITTATKQTQMQPQQRFTKFYSSDIRSCVCI